MQRRIIHIKLGTISIPSHTFDENEFIEILPRHSLSMAKADELAGILKTDIQKSTAQWLRELFKCQIIKWQLSIADDDGVAIELPLPHDDDGYEKKLDKGVLLLFASLVTQLKLGNEDIITEWGTFSIALGGSCSMLASTPDADEKKS